MPFGLGFFATAGAGAASFGSFDLLETQVLGSSAASVTFSSLSSYSGYKHLQLRMTMRSTDSGAYKGEALLRINADTGSNYSFHNMDGTGSSVRSGATANSSFMPVCRATNTTSGSGQFNAGVVDLLDFFETTKYLTIRSFAGGATTTTSSNSDVYLYSGSWRSTTSRTSLTLSLDAGNFVQYSRFSLYGIRGV